MTKFAPINVVFFAMQTEGRGAGRDASGSNFHDESRLDENYMQQALRRVVLNVKGLYSHMSLLSSSECSSVTVSM